MSDLHIPSGHVQAPGEQAESSSWAMAAATSVTKAAMVPVFQCKFIKCVAEKILKKKCDFTFSLVFPVCWPFEEEM